MMEDVSDDIILTDLAKKAEKIKERIKEMRIEKQKDSDNRQEFYKRLAEILKSHSDFEEEGDEKGWGKYLASIPKPTVSLIEEHIPLDFEHWWIPEITNLKNKKILEYLSRENILSLMFRLRGILIEMYDFEKYDYSRQSFEELSKNIKTPGEEFPLMTFIFSYYPTVFFHSNKEVEDSLDLKSVLSNIDMIDEKQKETLRFILKNLKILVKYIDAFSVYQSFLFYSKKWYRDHLLHAIRVMWMIEKIIGDKGWYQIYQESSKHRLNKLLCDKNYTTENFFNAICNCGGLEKLKDECQRNGLVAGLFHDLMYPVSSLFKEKGARCSCIFRVLPYFVSLVCKKKKIVSNSTKIDAEIENLGKIAIPFFESRFLESELMRTLHKFSQNETINDDQLNSSEIPDLYWNEAKQKIKELQDYYTKRKNEYCEKFLVYSYDHGVLGGTWLRSLPLESRQAIAIHNIKDVKIDSMEMPIAFFLVLSDEAQEWGRWIKSDKNPEEFFVPREKIQWEVDNSKFLVKINFNEKKEEIKKYKPTFNVKKLVDDKFKSLSRLIVPNDLNIVFSIIGLEGEEWRISGSSLGWERKRLDR